MRCLHEVRGVDIRDEAERQVAPRVVPERLVGHDRPEVGASDSDVDDVADRPARVARPRARADALGERDHAVEHLVHAGNHVLAVHDERCPFRHAQRDVQDGPVLGRVDPVAAEHRLRALGEARLLGQLEEEAQGVVGDAVLRVVEVDPGAASGESLAAGCVLGEELAEV